MSQMACQCGSTIRDTQFPCPTEGWIVRDQDREMFSEAVAKDITSFFLAINEGRRAEWIGMYFSASYPIEVHDEGIITDIISTIEQQFQLSVAECEQCGRLWVQREPGVNIYRSYTPDEPGYAGALRSKN